MRQKPLSPKVDHQLPWRWWMLNCHTCGLWLMQIHLHALISRNSEVLPSVHFLWLSLCRGTLEKCQTQLHTSCNFEQRSQDHCWTFHIRATSFFLEKPSIQPLTAILKGFHLSYPSTFVFNFIWTHWVVCSSDKSASRAILYSGQIRLYL